MHRALSIGEILALICGELANDYCRRDLRSALCVSRAWAVAARPFVWRCVTANTLARVPLARRQDVAAMVRDLHATCPSGRDAEAAIASMELARLERLVLGNESLSVLRIAATLLSGRCPRLQKLVLQTTGKVDRCVGFGNILRSSDAGAGSLRSVWVGSDMDGTTFDQLARLRGLDELCLSDY
jgi:hypothetical protein